MRVIENASLILKDGILQDGSLAMADGLIVAIGRMNELDIPADAVRLDAQGHMIGPGFVDIHCHGGNGAMFDSDPVAAAEHFLSHGETTVLATLYYQLSFEEMLAAIGRIRQTMVGSTIGRAIGGIYMEGPYMNPLYGASPEKNKWRGPIDMAQAEAIVRAGGDDVRVWAVAPEREGIEAFVRLAKSVNPTVHFAVGHSEATPAQIFALKQYGLKILTHCTNATGAPVKMAGTRSCGPDEACFYDPDFYAEVICDSCGIHVHPDMLRLIYRLKGQQHVVLISDSFVSIEQPPDHLRHIVDLQFDANGNLSGSKLTLDIACRNMMRHTGIGICQAFGMASLNPACAVGLDHEVGSLECGKRANLVLTDDQINIHAVLLDGALVAGHF